MFLLGLFGLAAVGGAAYAMSDIFSTQDGEDDDPDVIEEDAVKDVPEGNLLEIDDTIEEPGQISSDTAGIGTVVSNVDGNLVIAGGFEGDALTGADGDDQINGYGGADTITGGDGNDVLYGEDGDDLLFGNDGDDVLHGQDGEDTLAGDAGDDQLYGHSGDDTLVGGAGEDELFGGQDNDELDGGDGNDSVQGGQGDDILVGGAGEDALFGGDGDDILVGADEKTEPESDFLNGGAGDDTILAGEGDVVTGGQGADQIFVDGTGPDQDVTIMDFASGQDKLLITWDSTEDPDINIEPDSENPDLTHVLVNGSAVAHLFDADGLGLEDIQLVSTSDLPLSGAAG